MKKTGPFLVSLFGVLLSFCSSPPNAPPSISITSDRQRVLQGQAYTFSVHAQTSEAGSLHVSVSSEAQNQPLLEQEQQINPGESEPSFTITPPHEGVYIIRAQWSGGENNDGDTLRFGVVAQEGGPNDLLTYQFLTIADLPTKICQLQEESIVNLSTPSGKDAKLHLIPDAASLKEAHFRAFYGELVDEPAKKVFVTCADQHIFGRIEEEDTLFFESVSRVGLPENMYIFYRQSDIDGKVLQDSIKSVDLQLAGDENIGSIPQALIRPQCQNLRIAGYLGYGASAAEARATLAQGMQILNRFIDFSYELVKLEPFELYPTDKDLNTAFSQFCGDIFKHQLANVTTYHLFLNPNPSVLWFCGGGAESTVKEEPQCGATQIQRSYLCKQFFSTATVVQTAAHEFGHSLGLGHDCTLKEETCNLMFSNDPNMDIYGNGPCMGKCKNRREFISDESLSHVEGSYLCNPKHLPQSCPRGCGAPRGTCDSTTGICACSTGFAGPGCDRCAPGYTGYPNCRIPAPSCTDGIRNGSETDVDCGGGCPKCGAGRACSAPADCTTGICTSNRCQPMPVGPCSGGPMPKVTWQARLVAPAPNAQMGSTVLQGRIHILGGLSGGFKHAAFTPATNSWQTLNDLPISNLFTDSSAAVVNHTLYAFDNGSGGTSYTYQYDAAADSCMAVAPNPFKRRNSIVGVLGNKIYQATGYAGNDDKVTVYDPASDRFSELAPLDPKSSVGSGGVFSGKLYVFGIGLSCNEAHVYDPATGVWTPLSADTQYHYGSKTIEHNGIFWVMGGQNSSGIPIDTVSLYDPAADKWCTGPKLPEPLMFFVAEEVNGKIYLIGGTNSSSLTDHVWEGTVS